MNQTNEKNDPETIEETQQKNDAEFLAANLSPFAVDINHLSFKRPCVDGSERTPTFVPGYVNNGNQPPSIDITTSRWAEFDRSFHQQLNDSSIYIHGFNALDPSGSNQEFLVPIQQGPGNGPSPYPSVASVGTTADESNPGITPIPRGIPYGDQHGYISHSMNYSGLISPRPLGTGISPTVSYAHIDEQFKSIATTVSEDTVNSVDVPSLYINSSANNSNSSDDAKKWVRWSLEEDHQLRGAVFTENSPPNWKLISKKYFGGERNEIQCKNRWKKALQPGLIKGKWEKHEDEIVTGCINSGMIKWSEIAKRLPGRIGEQVKERWLNVLDPDLKKGMWTPEEVHILHEKQALYGNQWSKIARVIPGRSENSVKNRWYNEKTSRQRAKKRKAVAVTNNTCKKAKV